MNLTRNWLFWIAGVWAASLGLAFLTGIWVHIHFAGDESIGVQGNGGFESEVALERHLLIRKLTGKPVDAAVSRESFPPTVQEALSAALADANTNFRSHALAVLLSGLDLVDIGEAVAFTEKLSAGVRRDEMFTALLRRWGELDGRSALAYALEKTNTGNREEGIAAVLAGWATYDPQTPYQWALANPGENPFQSDRLNAVIGQMAAVDPATAFSHASSLPMDSFRTGALRTLADQLHTVGKLSLALPWFADLPEGPVKEVSLEHVARIWSSYEPVSAAEWVERNSEQFIHSQAISAVASTWGRADPQRAATWASQLPTGRARMAGLSPAIGTWLNRGELNSVASWLNQQPPHQDFDDAVRQVALASMIDDPETAMSWADSISDDNLRSVTMNMVGQRWMSFDPSAALAYYGNTGQATGPTETYLIGESGLQVFEGEIAQENAIEIQGVEEAVPVETGVNEPNPQSDGQSFPESESEIVDGNLPDEFPEGF